MVIVVGRRLLATIPVLLVISLVTFSILSYLPGNAAVQLLGVDATAQQIAELEAELRLDRPFWVRYWSWLSRALRGDLNESLTSRQPVMTSIVERAPVTFALIGYALALSVCLSVPMALLAAHSPNGPFDRICAVVSMAALSIPSYVFALLLVLIFAVDLALLPAIGYTPPHQSLMGAVASLTLPALAISLPLVGLYARFLRGDIVEQMQEQGYIMTAMAKGMRSWHVLTRHALRNSAFGLLTVVGLNAGGLVGGTVIIEQIFALPGIGQLLMQAISARDVSTVQAVVLLLVVITVMANLTVDLLSVALDPRLRHEPA